LRKPVLDGGDPSEILLYVLLSQIAHRYLNTVQVKDTDTKDTFRQEDSFRVMAERAMAEIGKECLGFIKPSVDTKIVLGFAAEFPGTALCVFEWMGHRYTSYVLVV
jgi:hypothetical protein